MSKRIIAVGRLRPRAFPNAGPHPRKLAVNVPPHPGGGNFHRLGGRTCPGCGGLYRPYGDDANPWRDYHPACAKKCGRPREAYWSIDTGNGDQLTTGLSPEVVARSVAQREANERGESVWLYSSKGEDAEEIEPERDDEDP